MLNQNFLDEISQTLKIKGKKILKASCVVQLFPEDGALMQQMSVRSDLSVGAILEPDKDDYRNVWQLIPVTSSYGGSAKPVADLSIIQQYLEEFIICCKACFKAYEKRSSAYTLFNCASANSYISNNFYQAYMVLQTQWSVECRGVSQNYRECLVDVLEFYSIPRDATTKALKERKEQLEKIERERPDKVPYFTEDLDNDVTLDMVYIPGGSFIMGSPQVEGCDKEKPQHKVKIKPFFLGKYQVTQKQWRAIAFLPKVNRDFKPNPSNFKGDNLPVEQVSWEDAVEFCQRLSQQTGNKYRLPTEAEWEYACRAGTTTPFHFGNTISTELANYNGNLIYGEGVKGEYREQTTPVGSFPSNAFGLYDMDGNVSEWCEDDWHDNYENAPNDGSAWLLKNSSKKVHRGGSWRLHPYYCRSAFRNYHYSYERSDIFGFRVVCITSKIT